MFLTERGASVTPVTHAAAGRVEERWAELTSPRELEALCASLLHLVTTLRERGRPGRPGLGKGVGEYLADAVRVVRNSGLRYFQA